MQFFRKAFYLLAITIMIMMTTIASAAETVRIQNAWIPEAPPTMKMMAAYFLMENSSEQAVTINSVSSPDFQKVEMHESEIKDGMARMFKRDHIQIPAGGKLEFRQGGLHLMLINPEHKLARGQKVQLRFEFANGNSITTTAIVKPVEENAADKGHRMHHHMPEGMKCN